MSTLHKELQKSAVKEVNGIIDNVDDTIKNITVAYNDNFTKFVSLSAAQKAYEDENLIKNNPSVIQSLSVTRDLINLCVEHLNIIKSYIELHIPKMEDGNNFGVTVQLAVLKELDECNDKWTKYVSEMSSYYSSRADALDKVSSLFIKDSATTETKTTTKTESSGSKDDDNTNKTTNVHVTEVKTTTPPAANISPSEYHRIQHVYAIDVQQYFTLKNALSNVKNDYIKIIDNLIKNKEKITEPKGSTGTSNFSSMY